MLPDGYDTSTKNYPLMLFLHGGDGFRPLGDINYLETVSAAFKATWEKHKDLEMVVVMPNVGRSFYLDSLDGKD